jgi:hypothetical protein
VDQEHSAQYQQHGDDEACHRSAARLGRPWQLGLRIFARYEMQRRAPEEPGDHV